MVRTKREKEIERDPTALRGAMQRRDYNGKHASNRVPGAIADVGQELVFQMQIRRERWQFDGHDALRASRDSRGLLEVEGRTKSAWCRAVLDSNGPFFPQRQVPRWW